MRIINLTKVETDSTWKRMLPATLQQQIFIAPFSFIDKGGKFSSQ